MEALEAIELADIMQVRDAATKDLQQRGGWRERRIMSSQPGGRRGEVADHLLPSGVLRIMSNQPGGRRDAVADHPLPSGV